MPKKTKQIEGEILLALHNKGVVSRQELTRIIEECGIAYPTTVKYISQLIKLGLLQPVADGFRLTDEGMKDGVITIEVTPEYIKEEVLKRLKTALRQFEPLITIKEV